MLKTPHAWYISLGAAIVLILATGVGFVLYELILIERNADASAAASAQTLALVNKALTGTHKNGNDGLLFLTKNLLQNGAGAANALKQTMQDANRIAKSQESKTVELADSSIALVKTSTAAVGRLDAALGALNDVIAKADTETLPKVNAGIDSLNGLVGDLRPAARASTDLLEQATLTIGTLNKTADTANALLADPELGQIVHNLNVMAANGTVVTGNLSLVTMDVHNLLNPKKPTFWEGVAEMAARSILGAAAGPLISHFWPLSIDVKNTVSVSPQSK